MMKEGNYGGMKQSACRQDEMIDAIGKTPEQVAASHARHYAALLAQEEPGTQGWQFVFGQLSAAATLTQALKERDK